MTFTASNRVQDNLQAVRNLLYSAIDPMSAVRTTVPHVADGFDNHLKNLAKLRKDLVWMLDQTDGAITALEAEQAAALTPAERAAKVELVAQAQQARIVPALPKDSDFHSSAAA